MEVQMKAAPQLPQQWPPQGPDGLAGSAAGYQYSAVPGDGMRPGAISAHSQLPEHSHDSYANGLQSLPHDAETAADNGGSRGQVRESQPVPGTTLHTTGGDEEVVAAPAEATGKQGRAAPSEDGGQPQVVHPLHAHLCQVPTLR